MVDSGRGGEVAGDEGALAPLRLLELGHVMGGPFCAMLLADLGADVIKIEPPRDGDPARWAPGFHRTGADGAAFLAVNRNKRSVALDLTATEGRELFQRLVDTADVLVDSAPPGAAERLGIGYEALAARNPRLVYASVSGFGRTGPYAGRPGADLVAQGMAGVMTVTGEPGGGPVRAGVPVADLGAGLLAALGVLAAIVARGRTGRGQLVDAAQFDAAVALSLWDLAELWATGRPPGPRGTANRLTAPYQALRTADGWLTAVADDDWRWRRLCRALGVDQLLDDPRFAQNRDRMAHRAELVAELEAALASGPTALWVDLLLAAGVPAGPVQDHAGAVADPQTVARGLVTTVEHPLDGRVPVLGVPVRLAGTPGSVRRPAPLLGEHTGDVLRELGLSQSQIDLLRARGLAG